MQILVVSDIHGNAYALRQALLAQPVAENVVFLGDGLRQIEDAEAAFPDRRFFAVPGNCDFGATGRPMREETFGGKRFFFSHGHYYGVKGGLSAFTDAARGAGADIALFGHTHEPYSSYEDGMYLMNPGSLADGHYGTVDICPQGILINLLRLP